MPDAPRLSVVIPTCNRLEILQQCLACLEAQTLPRELFEVLLVDDASTDATPAFLDTLRTPLQLRLFRQAARGGPARARNVGIRAARGEFILFLNDDALMEPGGLQTHLETHLALPAYRLSVLGRFELPAAFRSRLWGYTLTHSDLVFDYGALRQDTLYGGSHYYTCNISTPRQALLDCGLFDERFTGELWGAEDIEIGHRLASLDPPVGVLFREGCAAEHRHELNVTDFGRMFRVRGGGAVHMFVRHRDMTVHYRDIRAADIRFWRALPEAVTRRVEALQALLRATESMRLPPASGNTGEAGAVLPPQGLKERDFPALYRDGLSLWRLREDRLIPLLDARLEEVRRTLAAARKGQCSMQAAARGIYPACLYLRWHHDTEGVCASPAIGEICKEPLN
ncbi:MAG: glycosyltransferase [Desulfovibrio sp.]|nr:glycosyltransferase [Desulfovibrio sp.]